MNMIVCPNPKLCFAVHPKVIISVFKIKENNDSWKY